MQTHSWILYRLQKRRCYSIVTNRQSNREYDKVSDKVVTSTPADITIKTVRPLKESSEAIADVLTKRIFWPTAHSHGATGSGRFRNMIGNNAYKAQKTLQ